jgi:hypothetical protein
LPEFRKEIGGMRSCSKVPSRWRHCLIPDCHVRSRHCSAAGTRL